MLELLHTYVPDPIVVSIGSFNLRWYGLFAALGLFAAWFVIERLQKKYGIKEDLFPLFLGSVIAGLIGARVYHVINELPFYSEYPELILQIWHGGLALHGGIIGAFLYAWYWVKKKRLSFGRILDIFATGGILIQIFGRFGNYFNQELYGRITDVPWSIPILGSNGSITYHHPTFLYEAVLNAILFTVLFTLHRLVLHDKIKLAKGHIFLVYLFFYSLIRASLELVRIDATPIINGVRLPIIVSAFITATALSLFIRHLLHEKKHNS